MSTTVRQEADENRYNPDNYSPEEDKKIEDATTVAGKASPIIF